MARFPVSYRATRKLWDGTQNPLDLLTPAEIKAAELYVASTKRGFGAAFKEHFGVHLRTSYKQSIFKNPVWLAYVRMLKEHAKDVVLGQLERQGLDALRDYVWAREQAKQANDYKEVRLGAQDALDRIGATRRQTTSPIGNTVVIVLKGAETHATVLKALPAVEADIIEDE